MLPIWMEPVLAVLLGYALGSIPFGLLLTRLTGGGDLRDIGSGNIGATNVLRTGNKAVAALTLLLDIGKGALAVILVGQLFPGFEILAGMGAFLGHLYPVWLRFNGGKGVATLLGIITALEPMLGAVFAVIWIGSLLIWRFSSLGGMLASASVPVSAFVLGEYQWIPIFVGLTLLVFWKHRSNIERLLAGEEPKVGASKNEG